MYTFVLLQLGQSTKGFYSSCSAYYFKFTTKPYFNCSNSSRNNINHVTRDVWVLLSPNSCKQPPRSPLINPSLGHKWKFNHQQTIKNGIIYLRIYISRFNNWRNDIDKPPLSRSYPFIGFLLAANKLSYAGVYPTRFFFYIKTMFVVCDGGIRGNNNEVEGEKIWNSWVEYYSN